MTKIKVTYLQRIDTISITDMNQKYLNFTAATLRKVNIRDDLVEDFTIKFIEGEPYWVEVL